MGGGGGGGVGGLEREVGVHLFVAFQNHVTNFFFNKMHNTIVCPVLMNKHCSFMFELFVSF